MRHRRDTRGKPDKGWRELGLGMRVVLRKPRRRRGLTLPETKGSSREHRKKDTMGRDRERKNEREGRKRGKETGYVWTGLLGHYGYGFMSIELRDGLQISGLYRMYQEVILSNKRIGANIFEE